MGLLIQPSQEHHFCGAKSFVLEERNMFVLIYIQVLGYTFLLWLVSIAAIPPQELYSGTRDIGVVLGVFWQQGPWSKWSSCKNFPQRKSLLARWYFKKRLKRSF